MIPLLGNPPILNDQNGISMADGTESMGNNKAGFAGDDFPDRFLDLNLCQCIHTACRFVQN
ncbi:hypothetical protein D3C75_1360610 [compost metagenome]